jgi:hypothetical protein
MPSKKMKPSSDACCFGVYDQSAVQPPGTQPNPIPWEKSIRICQHYTLNTIHFDTGQWQMQCYASKHTNFC